LLLTKRKVMGFYSCGYIPLGSKTPFPCWIWKSKLLCWEANVKATWQGAAVNSRQWRRSLGEEVASSQQITTSWDLYRHKEINFAKVLCELQSGSISSTQLSLHTRITFCCTLTAAF
jgi:hypothetical protein